MNDLKVPVENLEAGKHYAIIDTSEGEDAMTGYICGKGEIPEHIRAKINLDEYYLTEIPASKVMDLIMEL